MEQSDYRIEEGGSGWVMVIGRATGTIIAHVQGEARARAAFGPGASGLKRTSDHRSQKSSPRRETP